MRRKLFNLSVALLTFGIGSVLFFEISWMRSSEFVIKSLRTVENEANFTVIACPFPVTQFLYSTFDKSGTQIEIDSDELFKPSINKWLTGDKIEEKLTSTPSEYRRFGKYLPELIDINFDNKKELAVKSGCDLSRTCYYTIFQEAKNHSFSKIFISEYKIKEIKFEKSNSENYQIIEAKIKLGNSNFMFVQYKFNGEFYEENQCIGTIANNKNKAVLLDCSNLDEILNN